MWRRDVFWQPLDQEYSNDLSCKTAVMLISLFAYFSLHFSVLLWLSQVCVYHCPKQYPAKVEKLYWSENISSDWLTASGKIITATFPVTCFTGTLSGNNAIISNPLIAQYVDLFFYSELSEIFVIIPYFQVISGVRTVLPSSDNNLSCTYKARFI